MHSYQYVITSGSIGGKGEGKHCKVIYVLAVAMEMSSCLNYFWLVKWILDSNMRSLHFSALYFLT